jgi:pyrimidine operon attenuation protein/uracil phosphoribosyltransferase
MQNGRIILAQPKFKLTIDRLCHQLIENYADFSDTCIISIQPRGTLFGDQLYKTLLATQQDNKAAYGQLDVTFYRDDYRRRDTPLLASTTHMDFLVENKKVLLIDDVLYSGRTIRAAMDALQHYGRPAQVELVVLVDRRFNRHLPIQANYVGITIDALDEAYVKVVWDNAPTDPTHPNHQVLLFSKKE